MIKIISGNEPYMVDCEIRSFTSGLEMPELNMRKFDVFNESVIDFLATCPIEDSVKVAVVHVLRLSDINNSFFKEFRSVDSSNKLIIHFDECDVRTSFYKELKKAGLITIFDKNEILGCLEGFLIKKAAKKGAEFAPGVAKAMISHCGYVENDEVNLYTLTGFICSMAAVSKTFDLELMKSIVPCFEKDDTFGIAKMITAKDIAGLRCQAALLRGDEIRCLSALLREYRISYKSKYYPVKEIGVSFSPFMKRDKEYLINSIQLLTDTIAGIKKGVICQSSCLLDAFLRLI